MTRQRGYSLGDIVEFIVVGIGMAVVIVIVMVLLILTFKLYLREFSGQSEVENKLELCNLQDGIVTNTTGNLFVISSDTSGVFSFYTQDANDEYHLCTIPADRTTIRIEEGKHELQYVAKIYNSDLEDIENTLAPDSYERYSRLERRIASYRLVVPPGTIIEDFKLDAT